MFRGLKLFGFMAIIIFGSILIIQHPSKIHVAFASENASYSSGFNKGCDDSEISDPNKRFINQPRRNQSFTNDEFTKGYVAGFDICSKSREPVFLGIKIAPDIGDITGVAALIASALIFWFGYSRARKSEQLKIARDAMDKIETKSEEFKLLFETTITKYKDARQSPDYEVRDISESELKQDLENLYTQLDDLRSAIWYFYRLINTHVVKDRVIIGGYRNDTFIRLNRIENSTLSFSIYVGPVIETKGKGYYVKLIEDGLKDIHSTVDNWMEGPYEFRY